MNIPKLEPVLINIWHKFEKDILVPICLDTDYQLDKGIEP